MDAFSISLDPRKKSGLVLWALVLIMGGLFFRYHHWTVIDREEQVMDDRWTTFRFKVSSPAEIQLALDVTEGKGVTAYLVDARDSDRFLDANASLFGGSFKHFEVFAAQNKHQHRAFGRLGEGEYVLAVKEGSEANILGGSDTARVHIVLTR